MKKDPNFDVIIIGSGPAGAHAAYPLVKKGAKVAMIDGGMIDQNPFDKFFNSDFISIRKTFNNQEELFLGKNFSSVNFSPTSHAQDMITGNKSYVSDYTSQYLKYVSNKVEIIQSLAKGGLSEIWGGACDFFDDHELEAIGLSVPDIKKEYQEIINRIGVSGNSKFYKLQPAANLDHNAKSLLNSYQKSQKERTFSLYQPPLAYLTKPKNNREGTDYSNMDFWLEGKKSLYRTKYTIEEMEKFPNFTYFPNHLVVKIKNFSNQIEIESLLMSNPKIKSKHTSKFLIIAAGTVNTARILLRSFNLYNTKNSFLTKLHFLIPCLNFKTLGQIPFEKQFSLCQLVLASHTKISANIPNYYAQLYGYSSLLLHRLLPNIPLPSSQAMKFLSLITPSLVIADVRIPSQRSSKKYSILHKNHDNFDSLEIGYQESDQELSWQKSGLWQVKKNLLELGLIPLTQVKDYATAHYAGTIPFAEESQYQNPFSVDPQCRLDKSKRIYIADASTWKILPAKPPTLTIMAQASLVGKNVLKAL